MNNMPMTSASKLLLTAALLTGAGAQAACYTVLGPRGQVLSETSTPPVDMSHPLHQTVPHKYGSGAVLVFGLADSNCGPEAELFDDGGLVPAVHRESQPAGARRAARAPRRDRH